MSLCLDSAPLLLRVVCSPRGRWDALNAPDDTPRPLEQVYCYGRLTASPDLVFLDGSHPGGGRWGQRIVAADYAVWPDPPPLSTLRDDDAWRAWAADHEQRVIQRFADLRERQ